MLASYLNGEMQVALPIAEPLLKFALANHMAFNTVGLCRMLHLRTHCAAVYDNSRSCVVHRPRRGSLSRKLRHPNADALRTAIEGCNSLRFPWRVRSFFGGVSPRHHLANTLRVSAISVASDHWIVGYVRQSIYSTVQRLYLCY